VHVSKLSLTGPQAKNSSLIIVISASNLGLKCLDEIRRVEIHGKLTFEAKAGE
jgi:hypothetical protein